MEKAKAEFIREFVIGLTSNIVPENTVELDEAEAKALRHAMEAAVRLQRMRNIHAASIAGVTSNDDVLGSHKTA